MIHHPPNHRSVPRGVDRYHGVAVTEPTPESLADDGRVDGIPVVQVREIRLEERRRLREVMRLGKAASKLRKT